MFKKITSFFYEIIARYQYTKGDKTKSIEWLIRASEIGSELAHDRLGERYFSGDGVTKKSNISS